MAFSAPSHSIFRLLTCGLVATGLLVPAQESGPAPVPETPRKIQGRVYDLSRAPIPGASVTAEARGSALPWSTRSGEEGEFSLTLTPGLYTLRIVAADFRDHTQALTVGGAADVPLDIVLQVAGRQDLVTVTETAGYQVLAPSSTKMAMPLRDVPQSISVVPRNLIRDQAMQSLADVVRYVPGITMAQGEGHRDAPVIRGNASTADFFVNGVRDDVQYYRDLYNVERVEAVKGANALAFGRGGGGGVINRVTKEAQFQPVREISIQGGSFGDKRVAVDVGQYRNDRLAFRLNGVYENARSFRHDVNLERFGVAPTVTVKTGERMLWKFAYEHFSDSRTVDRGIPSFAGRPSGAHRSTFFGDPDHSYATAGVDLGSVTLERQLGSLNLRNSTLVGGYDKFYQNVFPGAVNAAQTLVSLSGYDNVTGRRNIFNQTDVTGVRFTGRLRHTILAGSELGRQRTDNFRNTAFFGEGATSINVPFGSPRSNSPVAFRQAAADADNLASNRVAAAYVQDQVELTRHLQVVAGVRYDSFSIDVRNHRNNENLSRRDNLISPRAALLAKPVAPLSLYASYSVSHLPGSGDQFSSLSVTTQTLKPEKFTNYEIGSKWDAARSLSFSTAVYRLDRTNTTARDPNDPSRILQTGRQRSTGGELSVNGDVARRWRTVGGYAYQRAYITSATTAAARGAGLPLVPRHTMSLWNHYRLTSRWAMGLGVIHQAAMFAGIDNTVRLPQFTRADIAAYYSVTEKVRLQANVENLFDRKYYGTAHSNNNIMPGYARSVRIGFLAGF